MTIQIEPVDQVPPKPRFQRKKKSQSQEIVEAALDGPTGVIRVQAGDAAELLKIYKSVLQWLSRHPDAGVGVRKDPDCLYVWKTQPDKIQRLLERAAPNEIHLHPDAAKALERRSSPAKQPAASRP